MTDSIPHLTKQFAYNAWANRETLRSLAAALAGRPDAVPQRSLEVMAHLVGAEWAWLRRLGPKSPDVPVWPNLTFEECDAQLRALSLTWKDYLEGLTPEALHRVLAYVNFKGERWTSKVGDILTHVVTHGCYHRGQVATLLGRAGFPVPYTDYIECVRRGYLAAEWPQ
jgi:uncharacterized damage-inducible protein DinB